MMINPHFHQLASSCLGPRTCPRWDHLILWFYHIYPGNSTSLSVFRWVCPQRTIRELNSSHQTISSVLDVCQLLGFPRGRRFRNYYYQSVPQQSKSSQLLLWNLFQCPGKLANSIYINAINYPLCLLYFLFYYNRHSIRRIDNVRNTSPFDPNSWTFQHTAILLDIILTFPSKAWLSLFPGHKSTYWSSYHPLFLCPMPSSELYYSVPLSPICHKS